MTDDIEKADSPEYIPNPTSVVKGNLIVGNGIRLGEIYNSVYEFSDISQNGLYSLNKMNEIFVDAENGDYNIKDIEKLRESIPNFENIPLEEIGRVAE